MKKPDSVNQSLNSLKIRLDQVNRAWTVDDHEALLMFYVRIVPRIMGAERCNIISCNQPAWGRGLNRIEDIFLTASTYYLLSSL